MSVELLDDKKITKYISLGIMDILNNSELSELFCEIIQNRQLYGHSLDTARYAVQIGLIHKNIDLIELAEAGLLHDIGKIDIPIEIIYKPGKLNDYERMVMNTHSEKGCERLMQLVESENIQDVALHHHEY
ncbi:MAG: HD domain-containing protein [Lachnospiraceae bacterium]|nr:HD domain-containing protein [Lachnospiraceae bacterium]